MELFSSEATGLVCVAPGRVEAAPQIAATLKNCRRFIWVSSHDCLQFDAEAGRDVAAFLIQRLEIHSAKPHNSDNRRAQSAIISASQAGRCGFSGWVRSLGIRPISFRNTAAECLYAGTDARKATFPKYCRASDRA